MNDLDIAKSAEPRPIGEIAAKIGIAPEDISPYGHYKAKVSAGFGPKQGKLVLVTAINPTPAGEGKTTVSVGLCDALNRLGENAMLALREPSLGPVFGMKGGATGGGYAQVLPMEDINLHFTGDLHAITTANNLLAAMVDNHIQQGNSLGIDPRRVLWRRCMDMNDRQLRHIMGGLGGVGNGNPREDGFDITAASEVMAVFCLAADLDDLKARLGRILVGYTYDRQPVTCAQIGAQGAMAALLRDALMPNLVQTIEGSPAFIHGGPFANIAHGCNSVRATRMALSYADICVTEAGFGADLGAEKFVDIKCRMADLQPHCAVIVATLRALKCHGGAQKGEYDRPDMDALRGGLPNLLRHVRNVREVWGLPAVVALNRFSADAPEELEYVEAALAEMDIPVALCDVWGQGGAGGEALAKQVLAQLEKPRTALRFTYADALPIEDKIAAVAQKIYGASEVAFSPGVKAQLARFAEMGFADAPVCIAKTQYSLSDDPKRLGAPEGHALHIRQARLSAGAGFIVCFAGDIIAMPGLPKKPAALGIDVDENGEITGLF